MILVGGAGAVAHSIYGARTVVLQRHADRSLEAALETVRAGAVPLASGIFRQPLPNSSSPVPVAIVLDVEPAGRPDLFRVVLRAAYLDRGAMRERTLETLVWRP